MEPMTIGFLLLITAITLAVGLANSTQLASLRGSMLQIVPDTDVVVKAHAAMTDCPYSKRQLETRLLEAIQADPDIKNVSRDDVRVVMRLLGEEARGMQPGELIAQARGMQSW